MNLFVERLIYALRWSGISQQDLADRCGMPKAMISQYRHGRSGAKYENAKKMADVLGVSVEWLMGGNVPMLESEAKDEEQMLNNYRRLNPLGKEKADEYIQFYNRKKITHRQTLILRIRLSYCYVLQKPILL